MSGPLGITCSDGTSQSMALLIIPLMKVAPLSIPHIRAVIGEDAVSGQRARPLATRNQGFMAHLIYLICLSIYQKIGLKCTENRPQMYRHITWQHKLTLPQMYRSASNVQLSDWLRSVWANQTPVHLRPIHWKCLNSLTFDSNSTSDRSAIRCAKNL